MSRCGWLVLCVALIFVAVAPHVIADDLSLAPAVSAEQLLADQLVLLANQSLAGPAVPTDAQLVQCGLLLDAALELTPADAELCRFKAEVARRLDHREEKLAALTAYCRLAPTDDAAQWQLIQLKLADSRLQTVEQRADIVKGMLDAGASDELSPALRSRMAAYLAAAAREAGDDATFAARLKQAVQLDATNRDAASMLYEWVGSRAGSLPTQRDAALVNLIRAAPTDASLRRVLAERLLSEGAYAAAVKQFEVFRAFERQQTSLVDRFLLARAWASALLASGRAEDAAKLLDDLSASLTAMRAAAESKADVSTFPASLPADLALIHIAALDAVDRTADANAAFSSLRGALRQRKDAGDTQASADLAWAALLFNRNMELVPELLGGDSDQPTGMKLRLTAWQTLRGGDHSAARDALQPLAESDAFAAYGLAMSYRDEDAAKQSQWLTLVATQSPGTLAGVLAAADLHRLQQPVPVSETGRAMLAQLVRWPVRLSEPDAEHATWTTIELSVRHDAVHYLDPVYAMITVRNATPHALAIANDGSLPSNVAVFLTPRREGKALGAMPPLTFDASRRIRLEGRESVRWDVRLDRALLGSMLTTLPTETITFGAVAVADPWVTSDAAVSAGPTGAIATVHAITRRGLANTPENIARWLTEIDAPADEVERMRSLARLMVMIATPTDDAATIALQRKVAERVNMFAADATPAQLAWLARFLAPGDAAGPLAPTRRIAARSPDPLVQMILLSTQVTREDDELLIAALRDGGPRVRAFAQSRLEAIRATAGLQ